jgi:hypothetical protein
MLNFYRSYRIHPGRVKPETAKKSSPTALWAMALPGYLS